MRNKAPCVACGEKSTGECHDCHAPTCDRHRYAYTDGNNKAITKNSPLLCRPCYYGNPAMPQAQKGDEPSTIYSKVPREQLEHALATINELSKEEMNFPGWVEISSVAQFGAFKHQFSEEALPQLADGESDERSEPPLPSTW